MPALPPASPPAVSQHTQTFTLVQEHSSCILQSAIREEETKGGGEGSPGKKGSGSKSDQSTQGALALLLSCFSFIYPLSIYETAQLFLFCYEH